MFHPHVMTYATLYSSRYDMAISPEQVLGMLKRSLANHRDIMDISWSYMSHLIGYRDAFSVVYTHGWYFDEDTRELRRLFEQMVHPKLLDKQLEDYL